MSTRRQTTPRATALNHVSIPAGDLDASESFYHEAFGLERIAAPNFGFPVRWLRIGDLQIHLQYDADYPRRTSQHFGIEVDDFEATYRTLSAMGAFEEGTRYASLWLLPSGEVQMFVRDPSGNLVEIDWPDVTTLDVSVFGARLRTLADEQPQSEAQAGARLFLGYEPDVASDAMAAPGLADGEF